MAQAQLTLAVGEAGDLLVTTEAKLSTASDELAAKLKQRPPHPHGNKSLKFPNDSFEAFKIVIDLINIGRSEGNPTPRLLRDVARPARKYGIVGSKSYFEQKYKEQATPHYNDSEEDTRQAWLEIAVVLGDEEMTNEMTGEMVRVAYGVRS